MKTRRVRWMLSLSPLLALLIGVSFVVWPTSKADLTAAVSVNRSPCILPDYRDTVIPPNIAPLNFLVEEPGTHYAVQIRSEQGETIDITSHTSRIIIPQSQWRRLLDANRGRRLFFNVSVRGHDDQWTQFAPIVNTIAAEDIDNYLFYRLMKPIYITYVDMAICQRDVRTYEESVVLSGQSFGKGCVNCHSFAPNHPDRMILHTRSKRDESVMGMIVARKDEVRKVDTRVLTRDPESDRGRVTKSMAAYTAWHPNGRLAAFSANKFSQFFHAVGVNRDVFDAESDLAIYHVDSNSVTTTPGISQPNRLETFPAWSPDGRFLYFCSASPLPRERFREVRYDLMRIHYNADSGVWGDVESVLLAEETGLSITEPKVSPDGCWLLFCMSDYGSFPAYQPSSDLYLMDLETKQYRRLEINSDRCESWHSWSSNSHWIAFASKRTDGLFARIYFSYIGEEGRAHKPLLLPQEDPTLYDRLIKTYNVPELSPSPAPVKEPDLIQAIRSVAE